VNIVSSIKRMLIGTWLYLKLQNSFWNKQNLWGKINMPNIQCYIDCVDEDEDGVTAWWDGVVLTEEGNILHEIRSRPLDEVMTSVGNFFLNYGKSAD
jgi:hypothetical protein